MGRGKDGSNILFFTPTTHTHRHRLMHTYVFYVYLMYIYSVLVIHRVIRSVCPGQRSVAEVIFDCRSIFITLYFLILFNQCSTTGVTKAVVCTNLCGTVHIKDPFLLIGKNNGGSRFLLLLSEWYFTICPTS